MGALLYLCVFGFLLLAADKLIPDSVMERVVHKLFPGCDYEIEEKENPLR